jgi:hypothetical protein
MLSPRHQLSSRGEQEKAGLLAKAGFLIGCNEK